MDYHAIIPGRPPELLVRVVDGAMEIIPPVAPHRQLDQIGKLSAPVEELKKPSN
jgi:hypothetical protein